MLRRNVMMEKLLRWREFYALAGFRGIKYDLWFVVRLGAAAVDVPNASSPHNVANCDALAGYRMEHLEYEALNRRWLDQTEELATFGVSIRSVDNLAVWMLHKPLVPAFLEPCIVLKLRFRSLPRATTKRHGQIYDGARPNIEWPRIVCMVLFKDLGCDIW
jgi:hypothetical protein